MKLLIILFAALTICFARPQQQIILEDEPLTSILPSEEQFIVVQKPIAILRDDRINNGDGSYSFDFEGENGIIRSEAGSPLPHANNAIGQIGSYSYPLPDGQIFTLKYVANEFGFQPESPFLPVAPAFPHPIPQFVLDQIAFADQQKEERRLQALRDASSPVKVFFDSNGNQLTAEQIRDIQFQNPETEE